MNILFPCSNKFILKVAKKLTSKKNKVWFHGYKTNNLVKNIYDINYIINNYHNLKLNINFKKKTKNSELYKKLFMMTSKRIYFKKNLDLNDLFWKLTNFFYNKLKKKNIKHVVFYAAPHYPFEFSLYYASKLLKINIYIFFKTSFDNYFIIKKDWVSSWKYKNFKLKKKIFLTDFNKSKVIKTTKDKSKNDVYGYLFLIFFIKQIAKILFYKDNPDKDGYFSLSPKKSFLEIYLKIKLYIKIITNKYLYKLKYSEKINYKNFKYVYYPIHFEPERTVCPEGGIKFSDQIRIIKLLRKSIPQNIKIIVKEHPNQFILHNAQIESLYYKKKEFYEQIIKIKNVVIAKLDYNSIELIKNSICTCTISGSAGWEALSLNKKVIIFSNAWYAQHKNCMFVNKNNKEIIKKIKKFIFKKNIANVKKMSDFKKYIKPYLYKGISIDPNNLQNKEKIIKNFTSELASLFKKNYKIAK